MEDLIPVEDPALWTAATHGQTETVLQLLAEGADINEKGGPDENTPWQSTPLQKSNPLYQAVRRGFNDTARVLLQHEAEVSAQDGNGETSLHMAVVNSREGMGGNAGEVLEKNVEALDVVKLLLQYGANVSVQNNEGLTSLHRAVDACHDKFFKLEVVRLLLAHGADPCAKDNDENTPLHAVADHGEKEMALLLIEKGVEVSVKNSTGHTPLHLSVYSDEDPAYEGDEEMALLLLEQGADVSAKCNDGNTSLHGSAASGHWVMVRMLLDQSADVSSENNDGKTPLDLCADRTNIPWVPTWRHEQVAALLLAEETRRVTWGAFTMGQHARLGAGSRVMTLHPELVKMILDRVEPEDSLETCLTLS